MLDANVKLLTDGEADDEVPKTGAAIVYSEITYWVNIR